MLSTARKPERIEAVELSGWVVGRAANELVVRVGDEDYAALRAASCLIDPSPGDHVLVCSLSDGRAYILAVLERSSEASATLSIDGDVVLKLPSGRFEVMAEGGLGLSTPSGFSALASSVDLQAADARVHFERIETK